MEKKTKTQMIPRVKLGTQGLEVLVLLYHYSFPLNQIFFLSVITNILTVVIVIQVGIEVGAWLHESQLGLQLSSARRTRDWHH